MEDYVFLIRGQGEGLRLEEMRSSAFDSEDTLQELIERLPEILAGDLVRPGSPRRWILVKREMGVADAEAASDRWSMDHLLLDQDGIPTLVEAKRKEDGRTRRRVVAQMLDYAAHAAAHWSIDRIGAAFQETCRRRGEDPDEIVKDLLDDDADEDATGSFWETVETNLRAGRIRMLIVADEIPRELRRIVEFLNEQMDPAEILAVELRHYLGKDETRRILAPRVYGQTEQAQDKKQRRTGGVDGEYRQALRDAIATQIKNWVGAQGLQILPTKLLKIGGPNVHYEFLPRHDRLEVRLDFESDDVTVNHRRLEEAAGVKDAIEAAASSELHVRRRRKHSGKPLARPRMEFLVEVGQRSTDEIATEGVRLMKVLIEHTYDLFKEELTQHGEDGV